jgi:hypothetical protein
MKILLKVTVFSLLTIAFFAGFSNYGIPEINPAPPPKEEKLDLGSMTMDRFVALGDKIFNGKGTCTLCHNAVGGRAPMLDKVAAVAPERMADPRYEGDADTLEAYLYESMVKPSAYVVAGFGKAGSNDTQSPMPDASTSAAPTSRWRSPVTRPRKGRQRRLRKPSRRAPLARRWRAPTRSWRSSPASPATRWPARAARSART